MPGPSLIMNLHTILDVFNVKVFDLLHALELLGPLFRYYELHSSLCLWYVLPEHKLDVWNINFPLDRYLNKCNRQLSFRSLDARTEQSLEKGRNTRNLGAHKHKKAHKKC